MKRFLAILLVAALPLISLSCTSDVTYTIAAAYDDRILVSQDKEMMERMIECAVTGKCAHLCVMELLPSRRVFTVEGGTKVEVKERLFSLSNARRVRILEGEHSGEDAWVYDRMLCQDRSSAPYQAAFARLYRTDGK